MHGFNYPVQLRKEVLLIYLTGTQEDRDLFHVVDLIGNGALYHLRHFNLLSIHEAHYRRIRIDRFNQIILKSERLYYWYGDLNWVKLNVLLH